LAQCKLRTQPQTIYGPAWPQDKAQAGRAKPAQTGLQLNN